MPSQFGGSKIKQIERLVYEVTGPPEPQPWRCGDVAAGPMKTAGSPRGKPAVASKKNA